MHNYAAAAAAGKNGKRIKGVNTQQINGGEKQETPQSKWRPVPVWNEAPVRTFMVSTKVSVVVVITVS